MGCQPRIPVLSSATHSHPPLRSQELAYMILIEVRGTRGGQPHLNGGSSDAWCNLAGDFEHDKVFHFDVRRSKTRASAG